MSEENNPKPVLVNRYVSWEQLRVNGDEMVGGPLGSVGFMPAFASEEDALKAFPGAEIINIGFGGPAEIAE